MNTAIFSIVLPVFLVVGLGFGLKKTGLVRDDFLYNLNRLIYFVALPSLLFFKIATADFQAMFNPTLLAVLILSTIFSCIFSYGYAVVRGYSAAVKGAFAQGAFRGNLAYIGLAIVYSAYGEDGLAVAGVLLGFLVPLLNVLSIFVLNLAQKRQASVFSVQFLVKQIFHNPLIVASIVGIIWSFLQLPFPEILTRALNIITGMALPLALISIGATFSFKKLRGDLGIAVAATVNKVVIMPLGTAVLLWLVGIRGQEFAIGVLLAGSPVATAAYIMAQQLRSDAELSGAMIMLSTLCSIGTYTLILYCLDIMMLV